MNSEATQFDLNKYTEIEDVDSVSDLIHLLTEEKALIHVDADRRISLGGFLYRGLGNANYELIPSALRAYGQKFLLNIASKYYVGNLQDDIDSLSESDQHLIELIAIREFYNLSDDAGLALPSISQKIHSAFKRPLGIYRGNSNLYLSYQSDLKDVHEKWPPQEMWPLIGVAQHYGLPTRMLDWTTDPFIAAFFAASDGMEKVIGEEKDISHISIWSMDSTPLWNKGYGFDWNNFGIYAGLVHAPYANNPNLNAQKGVFTLVKQRTGMRGAKIVDSQLDAHYAWIVDEREKESGNGYLNGDFRGLKKICFPIDLVPDLMMTLDRLGFNPSTIFPGFKGAVQSIESRLKIDKLKRARFTA